MSLRNTNDTISTKYHDIYRVKNHEIYRVKYHEIYRVKVSKSMMTINTAERLILDSYGERKNGVYPV